MYSMRENEQELLENLRALAEAVPREAPSHVKECLLQEFRRRSAHRHRMVWFPATGIAGVAAALVILLVMPKHPAPFPVNARVASADSSAAVSADPDSDFYPLPEAEGLPPVENATIIRVQLPVESLQSMGLDVNADNSTDQVQADILLGQDGLARAVRFVE